MCPSCKRSNAVDELPPKLVRDLGAALGAEYGAELMRSSSKPIGQAYEGSVRAGWANLPYLRPIHNGRGRPSRWCMPLPTGLHIAVTQAANSGLRRIAADQRSQRTTGIRRATGSSQVAAVLPGLHLARSATASLVEACLRPSAPDLSAGREDWGRGPSWVSSLPCCRVFPCSWSSLSGGLGSRRSGTSRGVARGSCAELPTFASALTNRTRVPRQPGPRQRRRTASPASKGEHRTPQALTTLGSLQPSWLPRNRAFDEGLVNATNWFDPGLTVRLRTWLRARTRLPIAGTSMSVDEAPLRAQLFTADQMEQHGRHLAAGHELTRRRSRDRLLRRLGDNEKVLAEICALLARSADQQRRVTPAGEWLLDNFYLIEEEIRTAKRHLPRGYSRELPRLRQRRERRPAARLRPRAAGGRPRRRPARPRHADALRRRRTRRSSRCGSASCGRSRSCCAWR